MKNLLIASLILSAGSAYACFDRDADFLAAEEIEYLIKQELGDSKSFQACIQKLKDVGVDLNKLTGARKEIIDIDAGTSTLSFMFQGEDSEGQLTRIYIQKDKNAERYRCQAPTNAIPKCH